MQPRLLRSVLFTGNLVRNADTGAAGGAPPAAPPAAPATPPAPPAGGAPVLPAAARLGGSGTPAAPPATPPAVPGVQQAPWYADLPPELHQTVQAKGWGGPKDAIESYVSLERVFGADKAGNTIVKLRPDATPEEKAAFWSQLGTPADPTGYDFKDVAGLNMLPQEHVDAARSWLHKAGVPADMAKGILAEVAAAEKAKGDAWASESERAWNEVMVSYGAEADTNIELAIRATKAYGLDTQTLDAMMRSGGAGAKGVSILAKMLVDLGKMQTEAPTPETLGGVAPGGAQGFTVSVEQAKAKIAALNADPAFQSRYLSPNPAIRKGAIEEMENWQKRAYPS